MTETNSVIITRYHDKLLFPDRKVIVGLFDDKEMVERYARIAKYLPVYYYNFILPQESINYLNSKRLKEAGLGIEEIEQIGSFGLYRLKILLPNVYFGYNSQILVDFFKNFFTNITIFSKR